MAKQINIAGDKQRWQLWTSGRPPPCKKACNHPTAAIELHWKMRDRQQGQEFQSMSSSLSVVKIQIRMTSSKTTNLVENIVDIHMNYFIHNNIELDEAAISLLLYLIKPLNS